LIPLCDLQHQYRALKSELDAAMQSVAENANFILGPNVKAFEKELAAYAGSAFAVGVGNGTDALHLALRALKLGPGDEVITTPFSFVATTEAIGIVGATPVFVDIDPRTFNIDVSRIEAAITARTRAIIPVHLYGQPCDMEPLMGIARSYGLKVVEDCAQAFGADYRGRKAGTVGDIGCVSFFPSKPLGCFGDGGAVLTDDPDIYQRVEMLRRHGGKVKYHHTELGLNSRLDELQAAVLRVKLPLLDRWNALRREAACRYNALLGAIPGVECPIELTSAGYTLPTPGANDSNDLLNAVYHQYTVVTRNREAIAEHLKTAQIGTAVYYPVPLHLQEVHAGLNYARGAFPNAERAADHCLSLPIFPELTVPQQIAVKDALTEASATLSSANEERTEAVVRTIGRDQVLARKAG